MEPEALKVLQDYKLRRQVKYVCAKSQFYQQKFKEAGLNLADIQSSEDLRRIPFTTKDELRKSQENHPPLGFHMAADMLRIIRIHSSSGTTGNPNFVGITRRDHKIWTQITARSLYTQGVRSSDIVIHAAGLTFFVGGLPVKDAIEDIGAAFVPIGTGASERIAVTAPLLGAHVMHCTPSYAIYLSDYLKNKKGMDPKELGIRKIVSGAELGAGIPSIRKRIQEDYDCILTEGLGNSDAAPIIFGECLEQAGMHFCAQEFILCELIDPDSGKVLEMKEGTKGELVYTHIDRECCPMIRFRTRDHVEVWTDRCSCGRTSFRVRCIGRTDDMLTVLGVNVFPSAIKDVIGSMVPRVTGELLIQLKEPPPAVKPPLKIKVELGKDPGDLVILKKEIEALLRNRLTFSSDIELLPSGSLPRYEFKAQLFEKVYEKRG